MRAPRDLFRPAPPRALGALASLAILATLAMAGATGCVSSQDIAGLRTQIGDVQRSVEQAQSQASSKQDVAQLDAQMGRQMESLLKTEADMQVRLQNLASRIEELQAKLEDTNYRLSQLSQQIATTNQELKSFHAPAVAEGTAPIAPPAAASAPAGVVDPKALYEAAYNDYLKGNYDLSMREFQEYLANFPDTDLSDNATYWIGETFYRQRKFRQAIEQYDLVMSRYPRGDKLASAQLKKAYAFLELGERSQGIGLLRQVVRQHPTSDEANLARGRLRELGVDVK
ncbi:MAG TPA: tol-pal system protein YbgF [Thermoanaerobaculia bacterium]|nr:tol-pal system protein YbgF [Thermoanaerobaculia bacterium]